MSTETESIPCRICGRPTAMTGIKLCYRCWEVESRIKADPSIHMIQTASIMPSEDSLDHILNILDRMHRTNLEMNARLEEFAKTVEAMKGSP